MLYDTLIAAAASLWDEGGFDPESEYLRGQVEIICLLDGLITDDYREKVVEDIHNKVKEAE